MRGLKMKFRLPKRRNNRLGIATEKREYDLPFNDDHANRFLMTLIALMTFLALLAAAGGLSLSNMTARWTAGLSNRVTIEIPGMDANGAPQPDAIQQQRQRDIESALRRLPGVVDVTTRPTAEVAKLVEPWLGTDGTLLGQVPLPVIMTVETDFDGKDTQAQIDKLRRSVTAVVPEAHIDTHEGWLHDLLRLTGALSFAAYLIGLITAVTTVMAVAAAVRSRMSAHHEQLEILHLIGATDEYICRQFQRHALQLSFIGAGGGFVGALATLALIDKLAGAVDLNLLPNLVLSSSAILMIMAIPALACLITVIATRLTVLQSLRDMP